MCRLIWPRFGAIGFVCIFLFMGILGCAVLQKKQIGSLVITPISGKPRSKVTIRGSGFVPGEKIEIIIVVDGVPSELGRKPMIKEANELGAFKTDSGIPRVAKPGMYTVKATGDKGTVAVAPLDVEKEK